MLVHQRGTEWRNWLRKIRVKGDGDGLAAQGNEVVEHLAGGTGDGLAEVAGLKRGRPENRQFNTATRLQI